MRSKNDVWRENALLRELVAKLERKDALLSENVEKLQQETALLADMAAKLKQKDAISGEQAAKLRQDNAALRRAAALCDEIDAINAEMITNLENKSALLQSIAEKEKQLTTWAQSQTEDLRRQLEDLRLQLDNLTERMNTRLDLARDVWSGLRSPAFEALLHAVFTSACQDVLKHYESTEVSISGALAAYLCARGLEASDQIERCLLSLGPSAPKSFAVQHIDCQKNLDVGGADLAIVLDINIPERCKRISFCAFQAKKSAERSLSFTGRELDQLYRLRFLTHASYYLLYPVREEPLTPRVLPARALASTLAARTVRTISDEELDAVSLAFCDYLTYDFVPGWSGDERRREEVDEFVNHVLSPIHILNIRLGFEDNGSHET